MDVEIYTDGACSPNPGPGGWGAVLRYGDQEKELYGSDRGPTTNNRMELTAPLRALEALTRRSTVIIHTDSTYVRDGITKWVHGWQRNGWLTKNREPVKNVELWRALVAACAEHEVEWRWVKGHAGDPGNERADRLAVRGSVEAGGSAVQPGSPAPRRERPKAAKKAPAAEAAGACRARTKTGGTCRIDAGASGLCHVHDPALQCGAPTAKGAPCAVATGGGRCGRHRGVAASARPGPG